MMKGKYMDLYKNKMKLVIYSDGSLTTNKDGSPEIGYLIFRANNKKRSNNINYASNK